jgi:hypothetical protein
VEQPQKVVPFAVMRFARFFREAWLRILVISLLLPVPCFWHAHLEAGDLASHTYNAWLAQLIRQGQAPGLWLSGQTNNVLFDLSLSALGRVLGLRPAEKVLAAACVLLFFWSAFSLIFAISRRAPWFLVPCLAMFSYGWVFQQGFMNYYLSVALALAGLAWVAGAKGAARWLGVALIPLIWMAHPLGVALYLAAAAYLCFAPQLEGWQQLCLLVIAALLPVGLNTYLSAGFRVERAVPLALQWQFNGCDQLSLYGPRYHWLARLLLIFAAGCVLWDIAERWRERRPAASAGESWRAWALPLQLYFLSFWCVFVLPNGVFLPQFSSPITLLTSRATLVCAVFLCALLGVLRPRKWHLAGFGALAALFFLFLFQDTARVDHMETQVEHYVRILPPGQRILAVIWPLYGSRILIHHIVDRSCIEHCFSYGNYEPGSGQFRVRAMPGNGIVMADARQVDDLQSGVYEVQAVDLPAFEIYQCNAKLTDLCMRELKPGDVTGSDGPHPYSH